MKLKSFIKGQLLVTIILFSLGQLGRIMFYDGKATIYLYEVSLIGLLVLLMAKYKSEPLKNFLKTYKSVGIFLATLVVTFFFSLLRYNPTENLIAFLYLLRLLTYFIFLIYFSFLLKRDTSMASFLKLPLALFLTITIASSILQYFLYPDLRNLFYLGWDPHLYRVFGTYFEPVIAATIFGLLIIFLQFQTINFQGKLTEQFIKIILFVLLLLTYARSAIFAICCVILLYFMKKNPIKGIVFIAVILLVLILLPKKFGEGVNLLRTSTIFARASDIQEGLKLASRNPIAGIGYNHIRFEKGTMDGSNHAASGFQSSFLIVLVTSGALGLITFIYMLYELAKTNMVSTLSIVYVSIVSLFDNVLLHPFILFMLFLIIGYSDLRLNKKS